MTRLHPMALSGTRYIAAAYRGVPMIQLSTTSGGFQEWRPLSGEGGVQGAIIRDGCNLTVVLPGTNERKDVLNDIDPRRQRITGLPGYWRAGFARPVENYVWPQVADQVLDCDRVRIYGHSYGAAMAGVLGAILIGEELDLQVDALLAFAPPRYCDAEGAHFLSKYAPSVAQRIVNGIDVVPWAVPTVRGWRHALSGVYLTSKGLASKPKWVDLLRALRTRGIQLIEHHGIKAYQRSIARHAK